MQETPRHIESDVICEPRFTFQWSSPFLFCHGHLVILQLCCPVIAKRVVGNSPESCLTGGVDRAVSGTYHSLDQGSASMSTAQYESEDVALFIQDSQSTRSLA